MASAGRILIMPKGNYDSSVTYEMLDLVYFNGTSWIAKKTTVGIEPNTDNGEYWQNVFNMSASDYLSISGGILTGNVTIQKQSAEIVLKENDTRGTILQKNSNDSGDLGTFLVDISGTVTTSLTLYDGKLQLNKYDNGEWIGSKIIAEIT